ncbi:MAG: YcnI family protein [Vogesella sp.]|nr:YcnI family protein [Vogesella sp.]
MKTLLLGAALAFTTLPALAHVTLETQQAVAGSGYKAVLRVPHGCDGSPTTSIRVLLPEGFRLAKPMPKAGWQLSTVKKAVEPFDNHGTTVREDVSEIEWRGGNLPDDFYDEFVFRGTLPAKAGETAWFKVVQKCTKGETRWDEIPADGKAVAKPAAGVKLTPPASPAHSH